MSVFIKASVYPKEVSIQYYAYIMGIKTPKIIKYDYEAKVLYMEKIPFLSISDEYGDKYKDVPTDVMKKVRNLVSQIRDIGINYPDITGYNFIYDGKDVWIIDFEHASFKTDIYTSFIKDFIDGNEKIWNPDFY